MLKALLRKQLWEIRNVYITGRKGKRSAPAKGRSPKSMYILLIFLYAVIMVSMFFASMGIGSVLIPAGLDWMYFSVMSMLAFLLGAIGSVMSTAQALFRSRDNEFLLAMPIPSSSIVFVRMISVYLISLVYESVALLPAIVFFFIAGNVTVLSVVFCILSLFIMAFLVTAFSCGAGWLVSLIAAKLKNQKIVLVFMAVILIGVIYYFQFNSSRMISRLVENAEQVAESIRGWGYPLYAPGLGMTGNVVGFLVFTGITALLFAIAYYAVTKSFSRIALTKTQEKQKAFRRSDIRTSRLADTLFGRELKRFVSSVPYMLNTGLGVILLAAGAVLALIKMQDIRSMIARIGQTFPMIDEAAPVIIVSATAILTAMCLMASCSISMEGRYIWIYQAMPIDPYQIFLAKLRVHLTLTGIPALACVLVLGIVFRVPIPAFICMIVFTGMFITLYASFSLMMDLKKPKLNWTNENQALKTNLTVFLDNLLGMITPVVIGGVYLLLVRLIGPELYLVIWIVVFAVLVLLIFRWLAGRGREIFRKL